jgi:hypothetical protein
MALIDRHAIDTNRLVVAFRFDVLLGAVVTALAQRLQRAELEECSVTSVRRDVIDNASGHATALRQADRTEWILLELEPPAASP